MRDCYITTRKCCLMLVDEDISTVKKDFANCIKDKFGGNMPFRNFSLPINLSSALPRMKQSQEIWYNLKNIHDCFQPWCKTKC